MYNDALGHDIYIMIYYDTAVVKGFSKKLNLPQHQQIRCGEGWLGAGQLWKDVATIDHEVQP